MDSLEASTFVLLDKGQDRQLQWTVVKIAWTLVSLESGFPWEYMRCYGY